jgi:hypothetical protein
MRIQNLENGVIVIDQDEALLAKIEGEDLSGIDVSDLPLNADTLGQQYLLALSNHGPVDVVDGIYNYGFLEAKRYAKLKATYLDKFSAK